MLKQVQILINLAHINFDMFEQKQLNATALVNHVFNMGSFMCCSFYLILVMIDSIFRSLYIF